MATIVLRTPFNFLEQHHPHFVCRRPTRMVRNCSKGSSCCRRSQNQVQKSDDYQVQMDVKGFTPEEITVKIVGRQVEIEAKSENKTENSFESQHIVKKFSIPEGYNLEDIKPTINKEGILIITASKPKIEEPKERVVPIQILQDSSKETVQSQNEDGQMNTEE